MRRPALLLLCLWISCCMLATARQSQATLGEDEGSVEIDRRALSASTRGVTPSGAFTVHAIETGSNLVREYVSPSGIVFGIAWNGLTHPDLSLLLGAYAAEYRDASLTVPREPGRRRHQVKTGRIVVEKWGHMRNLRGRAYVPSLMPAGVSFDEIR